MEGKKKWTEFVAKEELERMKEHHQLRRKDPASAPGIYEFKAIDRKGNVKDIFINTAMIPGTVKSVASLVDITERKKVEESLRLQVEIIANISEGVYLIRSSKICER